MVVVVREKERRRWSRKEFTEQQFLVRTGYEFSVADVLGGCPPARRYFDIRVRLFKTMYYSCYRVIMYLSTVARVRS